MNIVDQWLNLNPNTVYPYGDPINKKNINFLQSRNAQGQFLLVAELDSEIDV